MRAARGRADRTTLLIALLGLTLGGLYFASIDLRDPAFSFGLHERIINQEEAITAVAIGDALWYGSGSSQMLLTTTPVAFNLLTGNLDNTDTNATGSVIWPLAATNTVKLSVKHGKGSNMNFAARLALYRVAAF